MSDKVAKQIKQSVLNRYERDSTGRILIDVSADAVEDLFSHWDRSAPYIRRDLDEELTDYLIDSAVELERQPFAIRFSFHQSVEEEALERITRSINVYFQYRAEKERQQINKMLRKSLIFLLFGLLIMAVAVWVGGSIGREPSVLANVLEQGLIVAAWVSIWESVATYLIEWLPQRKQRRLFSRLAEAPLSFRRLA